MNKVNANFENQKVFVGLDVHKRSWNAAIFLGDYFVRNIHQPPSPQALQHFLTRNYPGAHYTCAYESGKFGFWIQRHFKQMGIDCLVVNPAEIMGRPGTLQKPDQSIFGLHGHCCSRSFR